MPDSVQVFAPGFRITDANGDPVSGAKLNFYNAGTTDAQTVYSDSTLATALPNPVVCDSAGAPTSDGNAVTQIYVGTAAYKVVITDSSDVTLAIFDNILGALDTSGFSGGGSGTWSTPVGSETADFTVDSSDYGNLTNCNPTGGTFTATLPSAVTAGNGTRIGLRHDGTANEVKISTISGETIKLPTGSTTSSGYTLTEKGHSVWLVSDGAGWTIDIENLPIGKGVIRIADRLSASPASPTGGARYILTASPTGDWLAQSEHDIAEADGQGGWIFHTPPTNCGWLAYVQDEGLYTSFQSSAWADQTGMSAAQTSFEKRAIFRYKQGSGTNGGGSTGNAWTLYPLNDFQNTGATNVIESTSLSSSVIQSLPQGRYRIQGFATLRGPAYAQIRLYNVTDSAVAVEGLRSFLDVAASPGDVRALIDGEFTVDSDGGTGGVGEDFQLEYYVTSATIANGLGGASGVSGDEIFGVITISDLEALQGPAGSQGVQGSLGPGYQATSTTSLEIGTGTKVFTTQLGLAYTAGARVKAASDADTASFMVGNVTSYSGTTLTVSVDRVGGSGTLADWNINVAGEDGAAGATGDAGQVLIDYTFDSASQADSDPGAGMIRANNATAASVTAFYIDDLDRLGDDQSTAIDAFDASTSSGTKATMYMEDLTSGERWTYAITAVSDSTGYWEVTVTHVAGTGVFASNNVAITVIPRGDVGSGDVTGAGSSTDGNLPSFNGTGGDTLQDSGIAASEVLVDGDIGTSVQGFDADTLKADTADVLTAGFGTTAYNAGTQSSGTYTPDESYGNMQYAVNGGAHSLAPMTNNGTVIVHYTNNGSAGAITTTGFTQETGDAFDTTDTNEFLAYLTKANDVSHLHIVALQ